MKPCDERFDARRENQCLLDALFVPGSHSRFHLIPFWEVHCLPVLHNIFTFMPVNILSFMVPDPAIPEFLHPALCSRFSDGFLKAPFLLDLWPVEVYANVV